MLGRKTSFLCMLHHPKYFGEITRVMRHICIFSRDIFSRDIFLMLGGCYCRLPARMFIWLVVESISI